MAKQRTQAPSANPDNDQVIYVGPTIAKIGLQQFAVFRGGVPEYIKPAVKQCGDLAELFKPVELLNHARREIQRQGSVLRQHYMNVRSFFNQ